MFLDFFHNITGSDYALQELNTNRLSLVKILKVNINVLFVHIFIT